MKERPILFNGEMVRAILEGRKTQTRRIVKWPVKSDVANGVQRLWPEKQVEKLLSSMWTLGPHRRDAHPHDRIVSPFGQVGDRLWVREAFFEECDPNTCQAYDPPRYVYRASYDYATRGIPFKDDGDGFAKTNKDGTVSSPWRPSIHMPRDASRLTLEIVSVRVERLQDISERDAADEGAGYLLADNEHWDGDPDQYRKCFKKLWNSMIERPKLPANTSSRRYSRVKHWLDTHPVTGDWDSNPWVWVIEFKVVKQ